jgi:hypothetical protein
VSPQGDPVSEEDKDLARAMEWAEADDLEFADSNGEDLDETSAAMAAVCALNHDDWLAVMTALVTGGPGTPASAADLARYIRDYEPGASDSEHAESGYDVDELSIEGLFLHVVALWSVLGAIDHDDRLTSLGWWGLPEAMQRAWAD